MDSFEFVTTVTRYNKGFNADSSQDNREKIEGAFLDIQLFQRLQK